MSMNANKFVTHVNGRRRGKMSQLELEAATFAFECHKGQFRKFDVEPYIAHPAEVASIVAQVSNHPQTLAAAWLHDVVEDCGVDIGLIGVKFGVEVQNYVSTLTNPSQLDPELKKLNRAQRKMKDKENTANAEPGAKTVKLADILSNINSLVYNDPSFARVWVLEKESLMPFLEEGNVRLFALVHQNILSSKSFLGI